MQCGIPVVPGYNGSDQSLSRLKDEVKRIGFPVLLKATMGGGGRVRSYHGFLGCRECVFSKRIPISIKQLLCAVTKQRNILETVLC